MQCDRTGVLCHVSKKKKRNSPIKKTQKTPYTCNRNEDVSNQLLEERLKYTQHTAWFSPLWVTGFRLSGSRALEVFQTREQSSRSLPSGRSSWTSCLLRPEGKLTPAHQMLS